MAHPGHHATTAPDAPALIMARSGEVTTWAELSSRAVSAAKLLSDMGLRPGDPVAFCIENSPEFVAMLWACQYAGFRWTPISTRLTGDEVAYIVGDCGASVLVHSAATAEACAAATSARTVDVGTIAHHDDVARYERVEGFSMLYSSGTTGRPKGVLRSAPTEPVEELSDADRFRAEAIGITADAVYLSTAPLYHSAPITFVMQVGRLGVPMVIMERFDAELALASIERHSVTHSQWVPTMFVRLLRLPDEVRGRYDLSSHRWALHGAGPCSVGTKRAMLDWWGPIVHEYYAGTEGAGTCLIGPQEWLEHPGSVGRSVSGPIHILDDDGHELPVGEVGQIWFEGSADFRYLNDADKTAGSRGPRGEGTFGDLGYLDADGYLYLTDRKSFTIVSGGVNIYPREIEQVLLEHPWVDDVAVFGVPDDEYGEQVKAVVQPADELPADARDGTAFTDALVEHCRVHLAGFKVPRSIDFDPALPREPTGKLRVAELRARYL
ncbi:MAG: AMP-binding protein [Microthrixaceae bacterium]|nr:AMP-binding protein [Acidimicrobiales bacterium]MCB1010607.1 AMP-binding protein [Microthrixaceae bacterium]MCB9376919.1 AMP-binding protein [Microthrixaceae bacterium]MCO5306063.1 AMP-binding protein [Microthrixaceae bacterium]